MAPQNNTSSKAHAWQKVISHTKVREIILADREAHSLPTAPAASLAESFHLPTEAVHAPRPNQTVNIDLCLVPLTHDGTQDMVSVSFSAATVSPNASCALCLNILHQIWNGHLA